MTNFIGWIYDQSWPSGRCQDALDKLNHQNTSQIQACTSEFSALAAFGANRTEQLIYEDSIFNIAVCGRPLLKLGDKSHTVLSSASLAKFAKQFSKYGIDSLSIFNGGFSIAIINKQTKQVTLAVDRMGTQQLFYQEHKQNTYFSSSLSQLTQIDEVKKQINPQAIYSYLYFHCIPAPETIYKNIFKLNPAEVLIIKDGTAHKKYFWQPDFNENSASNVNDLQINLKESLSAAVKDSLLDTSLNTGAFLSGGTDSSTLAGLLKEHSDDEAETISMGFEEQGYDEMEYADLAAKHFGNKPHQYYVTFDDISSSLTTLLDAYDEPFGNSSAVPTYIAAKFARKLGITHLLAGDGGDELFGGNERYAKQKVFEIYSIIPELLRNQITTPLLTLPVNSKVPILKKIKSYVEQANIAMPDRLETYNFLHRYELSSIFTSDFLSSINTSMPSVFQKERFEQIPSASLLNKMLFLDWKFTLADNDLRKVGTMCERAGVQVSYPFLDNRVIENSTQIPSRLKIKGTRLRHFYKETYKDFLPERIINKSKHGFGLPFGAWLKKDPNLQKIVYEALSQLKQRNIFKNEFLDKLVKQHNDEHAAYYGSFVWVFAILELWLSHNNENI